MFFIGLAFRSEGLPEDAVNAYNNALQLCPLYSDCYFNLGNIYFEGDLDKGADITKAELCHRNALQSLEETERIGIEEGNNPKSIITVSRVCNMLGEISKRKNDYEAAISYYLQGLEKEPLGYIDNYLDLADISEMLNEQEVYTIIMTFAKFMT